MSDEIKTTKALCYWCHCHCKTEVTVRNGRLEKVEEVKNDPRTDKLRPVVRSCPRARAAADYYYHPDRLTFPLKRTGERGAGKWQQISWDQALDEIASKITELKGKYGPQTISSSSGTSYRGEFLPKVRFFSLLGTAMNGAHQGNICFIARAMVANAIVGMFPHYSLRPTTRCIVLLGRAPRSPSNYGTNHARCDKERRQDYCHRPSADPLCFQGRLVAPA